jgi:hypothetical protein
MATATGTGIILLNMPTAAGSAQRWPARSRILPASTGSISHVRILTGDRSPDNARYFHEIM